jgi:F-type H+-transporting ATPase subunit a
MAAEEHALTSTEYIKHHLTNMTYGKMPDGTWKLAETAEEAQQMGFTAIHLDSMGWSIGLGVIFCLFFGVLRKLQMLVFQQIPICNRNDHRVC